MPALLADSLTLTSTTNMETKTSEEPVSPRMKVIMATNETVVLADRIRGAGLSSSLATFRMPWTTWG